jgi:hypothetical protein
VFSCIKDIVGIDGYKKIVSLSNDHKNNTVLPELGEDIPEEIEAEEEK